MSEASTWDDLPLVMTTEQVADLLHLHVNTVKALCRSGMLPAAKIGHVWRIQRADVLALFASRQPLSGAARHSPDEHQDLARRLVEVQEAERRAVARELHDEAGQMMTALKLKLSLLRRDERFPADLQDELAGLQTTVDEIMLGLHQLAMNLRPPSLDRYGLVPALEQYIAAFRRQREMRVEFFVEGLDQQRLPDHVATAVYRIVQEALTNIARHAQANQAGIVLSARGGRLNLVVEDDGQGFDVAAAFQTARLGLLGMRERVEMLGGTLDIESGPGGTRLFVDVPCPAPGSPTEPNAIAPVTTRESQPFVSLSVGDEHAGGMEVSSSASAELVRAKMLGDRLHELHLALDTFTDTGAILQRVADDGAAALGCEGVTILLREGATWVVRATHGLPPETLGTQVTEAEYPLLRLLLQSDRVVVENDLNRLPAPYRESMSRLGMHALVITPVSIGGHVSGIILFSSHLPGRQFLPSEVEFVRRLGAMLSLALESAQLRRGQAELLAELDTVLAAIPDSLIIYDNQGRIVRMNRAAEELLGYTTKVEGWDLQRRLVFGTPTTIDGRPYPVEQLPLARALRGETVRNEIMMFPPAGVRNHSLWVVVSAAPTYRADGSLRGAVGTLSDITELRTARVALEAANASLIEIRADLERRVTVRTQELEQANAELQRHSEQLQVLNRIDRAILASQSTEEIARIALAGIRRLTGVLRASVQLFDVEHGVAEVLAADGAVSPGTAAGTRLSIQDSAILREVFKGRASQFPDLVVEPGPSSVTRALLADGIRAVAALPLNVGARRLGALLLGKAEAGPWTQETLALATQVADSLAVALANAGLYQEVEATGAQLQALSRRVLDVQERERHHVADQLYNEAAQVLAALKFQLNVTAQELEGGPSATAISQISERVAQMQVMADQILAGLHSLAVDLRPASLDRLGLAPALKQYCEAFGRKHGLTVQFETLGLRGLHIPSEVEVTLYRVAQEALSNIARHAQADTVGIGVSWANQRLSLLIEDDGIGFDPVAAQRHGALGLLGMRERVAAIGGNLTVESAAGAGTTLLAEVVLDDPDSSV